MNLDFWFCNHNILITSHSVSIFYLRKNLVIQFRLMIRRLEINITKWTWNTKWSINTIITNFTTSRLNKKNTRNNTSIRCRSSSFDGLWRTKLKQDFPPILKHIPQSPNPAKISELLWIQSKVKTQPQPIWRSYIWVIDFYNYLLNLLGIMI